MFNETSQLCRESNESLARWIGLRNLDTQFRPSVTLPICVDGHGVGVTAFPAAFDLTRIGPGTPPQWPHFLYAPNRVPPSDSGAVFTQLANRDIYYP